MHRKLCIPPYQDTTDLSNISKIVNEFSPLTFKLALIIMANYVNNWVFISPITGKSECKCQVAFNH